MEAFIGQVVLVGFNFAPYGWAFCDGSLLPISEYSALYTLIGTTYGGDGVQTFGLPDLRGRTPIGDGTGPGLSPYVLGQRGGAEQVTITAQTYPKHTHSLSGTSDSGNAQNPSGALLASGQNVYRNSPPIEVMNAAMVGFAPGNSLPHANLQPYQCCNWIISLFGIFPAP
jgi:microcystin-dependent protein